MTFIRFKGTHAIFVPPYPPDLEGTVPDNFLGNLPSVREMS